MYQPCPGLITQMDDGATTPDDGAAEGRFTSSVSAPTIVVRKLGHLDLRPGRTVLEIGTGTGYNAALLCERVGDRRVVTVEIDASLAQAARAALLRAGYAPEVVVADGEAGWPERAPYDRVLSTASVARVPWPWVEQTAPDGVILTPFGSLGLLRLVVDGEGRSASGRFADVASFMITRGQRAADGPDLGALIRRTRADSRPARCEVDMSEPADNLGARFALHLQLPDVVMIFGSTWWVYSRDGSAWAGVKKDGRVRQWGERDLFDEVASLMRRWNETGKPDVTRFGLTVTPTARRLGWTPRKTSWARRRVGAQPGGSVLAGPARHLGGAR